MVKIIRIDGKFYFDEDDKDLVECKTWLETSKKSAKNPEGKLHILLPRDNSVNRQYLAVDKFNAEAVNEELILTVKESAPRVLGATGVKQNIIKYLDEADAAEYTELVTNAVDTYKASKTNKHKKPEEMTAEELEEYIAALKEGRTLSVKEGPKSFIDCFTEEQYNRYNELLAKAMENKANAPKAVRGPLTAEEKAARKAKTAQNKITKLEALLAKMKAANTDDTVEEDIDEDI